MKILIVGQHYYPDNFKISDISFELVKQGHSVTMLTGLPDYATGKIPKEYRLFRKRKEVINGVKVRRVPIIARRSGMLWRMMNYVSFLINSYLKAAFMRKDFDVIFCYQTSPVMMAHAAIKMKRRSKSKLFLYCLDLWPESLKAWDVKEDSFLFRVMHKYSKKVYQNCDVIGISSKPFASYLVQKCGVEESRIVYLPQDADAIAQSQKIKETGFVDFAFGGNVGKVQDVECIVRAVNRLRDNKKFKVHIFGSGTSLEACIALSQELDVDDRIKFYGRVDKEKLIDEYKEMDAFILTLKQQGFIGMTVPTKLQEYMSAGKPIIAAINGAAADIILDANCGLVGEASNDIELAKNMLEFIENVEDFRDLGYNAHGYYKQNFTREIFIERLNTIFDGMRLG